METKAFDMVDSVEALEAAIARSWLQQRQPIRPGCRWPEWPWKKPAWVWWKIR